MLIILSFLKLLDKRLPPLVVRLLLMWYSEQRVKVKWKSSLSSSFGVSNGVRQGGVLSPILLTVYIDELLLELEKAGVGCYWRHHFVGAVCYADDVALLAPSPSALRLILDTCRRVANSLSLIFNAAETQLICFSSCASDTTSAPNFVCLGESLSLCKTVTHLGHVLSHDLSDAPDIRVKAKDVAKKANYMLYSFSCCDKFTKTSLLQSFCLSLPGSVTWKLSCLQLKSLEVTFNNTLRKV